MPLCRKCRVREASEIWHNGLCPHCYFEYNEKRKKEEQRDREQRESQDRERRYREERDREERRRRDAQEREERQHRERLEELREEEVEYQRQAARDAEIAREEAEETRRIAGLTTFTCCHCQGTFNEERGYSAIETPIGKPVCNKCYELLKKCTECNQYFWKNDPRSTPIRPLEKEYYKSGSIIKVKDRNDYICDNCVSTAKYESFFAEQKKLKQEYDNQERIRREKEAAERAERERKEAAERAERERKEAEAAELARIKAKEEQEARDAKERERENEDRQNRLLLNTFFGIFFTLLSIYTYCSLLPDKFTGLILGLILGIGVTTTRFISFWGDSASCYFDDFKESLGSLALSFVIGALISAWLAFMTDSFKFTETFVTPFCILSVILTLPVFIAFEKQR